MSKDEKGSPDKASLNIAKYGKTKEASVHTSCMEQFASMVGLLVKGLVENFGEKGRMIAERAALESGMFCAKRSIEARGIIERGSCEARLSGDWFAAVLDRCV